MHEIYELKEMLCRELEDYGKKGDLDVGSLEIIDKLAHAVKNLGKIIEMDEENEYSMQGGGNMGGNSYRYDGRSMRGGSYARGRGRNARRDSRGRYSSYGNSYEGGYSMAEDDMDNIVSELRDMMVDLPQEKQQEVRRFIDKMDHMK